MSPLLRFSGGKYHLQRMIRGYFPKHTGYCELFAGGLSIMFARSPVLVEIANDLDPDVINFYRQLITSYHELCDILDDYDCCHEDFDAAAGYATLPLGVERAAQYFVRNRMSRNGSFSWSSRTRRGMPEMVSRWITAQDRLSEGRKRLSQVQFHNLHFRDAIPDDPDILIYADPPYLPETRTSEVIYAYEMTYREHQELLGRLQETRSPAVISHYPCSLYNQTLKHWSYRPLTAYNPGNIRKGRRIEGLWVKPHVSSEKSQSLVLPTHGFCDLSGRTGEEDHPGSRT